MRQEQKAYKAQIDATAEGRFAGKALVYNVVDSYSDIGRAGMFTKTIAENSGRIRIMAQHDTNDPIGWATLIDKPDALYIDAHLEMKLASARQMFTRIQAQLVDGLSIGFLTRDSGTVKVNGELVRELRDVQLFEVSCVTFQAVPGAVINPTSVKARGADAGIDEALQASLIRLEFESLLSTWKAETDAADIAHAVKLAARRLDRLESEILGKGKR